MEKINTTEGNRLIAEFMGVESCIEQWRFPKDMKVYLYNGYWTSIAKVKYHTSWDWLMPVVEKIESLGSTTVQIYKRSCEITPILYSMKKDKMVWHNKIYVMHGNKMESVYDAVLQFITWYNSVNSPSNNKTNDHGK